MRPDVRLFKRAFLIMCSECPNSYLTVSRLCLKSVLTESQAPCLTIFVSFRAFATQTLAKLPPTQTFPPEHPKNTQISFPSFSVFFVSSYANPCFFECFPFFLRYCRGSEQRKILVSSWFSLLLPKKTRRRRSGGDFRENFMLSVLKTLQCRKLEDLRHCIGPFLSVLSKWQ